MNKVTIRWMSVNPETNEFLYDLGMEEIDIRQTRVNEAVVALLLTKWSDFGENGDCIVINDEEV